MKIFQIVFINSYYKSHDLGHDFSIQPTASTISWMAKRNIRLLRYGSRIVLVWLVQHYDDPLELFKKKVEGLTISFIVTLQNSQLLNLSELEIGHPTGTVYYLHNRHPHKDHLLHSKTFIGATDLLEVQALAHEALTQPGNAVWGMIDIDFSYWSAAVFKQQDLPITYTIQVKNRATFWRYYFVDMTQQLKGELSVVASGTSASFAAVQHVPERLHTYWTESKAPIELYDHYAHSFALCKRDKKNETIVVEKLPYPTPGTLTRGGSNKKKLYSDIVVYV
ncbi:MAG: hypothetical protein NQ127_03575 [Candidatus Cardinium sp.]|nr:hypothetical protein [Candidatus Cardinium sp.]